MGQTGASMLRNWWSRQGTTVLGLAIALMALLALLYLGDGFHRLLDESRYHSAFDLRLRYTETHRWFAGKTVYREFPDAVYPPASYVILWPLLGWLTLTPARWLWAATAMAALLWLVGLTVRESGAAGRWERTFVALIALAMPATGVAVGVGQLIVYVLPMLIAALVLLHRGPPGWGTDLLASGLFLAALMKPSITAPFFWMVLFVSQRLRPALLICLGYLALTLSAASFQKAGLPTLLREWLARSSAVAIEVGYTGYANLHTWLLPLGMRHREWLFPASMVVLGALGLWTNRHRKADPWVLMGVTALVARFWTYHRLYDDGLILLPMIALFRIARQGRSADGDDVWAGVLLAVTLLAMLVSEHLRFLPPPWYLLYTGGHAVVWIGVLVFLTQRARRETTVRVAW